MKDYFELGGRVVAVTGAAGVLAGGTARYLQQRGATVVYLDLEGERLDAALEQAKGISDQCAALPCDVLDRDRLAQVRDEVKRTFGRVDALINGAGGNRAGATIGPDQEVFDLEAEAYDRVLDLNLKGTVLPTLAFAEAFREQGAGCVVNFSSMAAGRALTRVLGYSNAKAAVENFTRWMATELAQKYGDGLRVNAVAPGFFIGEQNRRLLTREDGSYTERGRQVIDQTPFGRFGEAHEVYGTVHYLLSDAASFVTGAVIPIDGGFSAYSGV